MSNDKGGPAFPSGAARRVRDVEGQWTVVPSEGSDGMTLRDWFAGQALAGLLANPELAKAMDGREGTDPAALLAFAFADSMLEQRKK